MSRPGGIRVVTLARDGDDVSVTDRSDISLMTRSRSPQDTLDAIVVALRGSSASVNAVMPVLRALRSAPGGAIDAAAFRDALKRGPLDGVVLDRELDALFRALDAGPEGRGTGALSSQTVVDAIRGGPMVDDRRALVHRAFGSILNLHEEQQRKRHTAIGISAGRRGNGKGLGGTIPVDSLYKMYQAHRHPRALAGGNEDDIFAEFVKTFPAPPSGLIELADFEEYYETVNFVTPDDSEFHLIMWNCWPLSENPPLRTAKDRATEERRAIYRAGSHKPGPAVRFAGEPPLPPGARGSPRVPRQLDTTTSQLARGMLGIVGSSQKKGFGSPMARQASHGSQMGSIISPEKASQSFPRSTSLRNDFDMAAQRQQDTEARDALQRASAAGMLSSPFRQSTQERLAILARERLRNIVLSRGLHGVFDFANALWGLDENGTGAIRYHQLLQVLGPEGSLRTGLTDAQVADIFGMFNGGNGATQTINVYDLLHGIIGSLPPVRKALVHQAFAKHDRNGNGLVDLRDLQSAFDADAHPDVREGRRQAYDIRGEVLSALRDAADRDGRISVASFERVYALISALYEDDDHFSRMMLSVWSLSEIRSSGTIGALQADMQTVVNSAEEDGSRRASMETRNTPGMSRNPKTSKAFSEHLLLHPHQAPRRASVAGAVSGLPTTFRVDYKKNGQGMMGNAASAGLPSANEVIERIRHAASILGERALVRLERACRVCVDADGTISPDECASVLREFGTPVSDPELIVLVRTFDRHNCGRLHCAAFLEDLVLPLEASRASIVARAFRECDPAGKGYVTVEDLTRAYDASRDALVISGEGTKEDAVQNFVNSIDWQTKNDMPIVSEETWTRYHRFVSAAFQESSAFNLFMTYRWLSRRRRLPRR